MFERFARSTRSAVTDAVAEAARRGDRRVGTEHLLLGLLDDPAGVAAAVLGTDVETARSALDALDAQALASVGVDVTGMPPAAPNRAARSRRPFTAAARDTLVRTLRLATGRGDGRIEPEHLLLALLERPAPDPVAQVIGQLGVDRDAVRARLSDAA
jgi:ATP-dependent Clp protease ATP-binding subunit ClpA